MPVGKYLNEKGQLLLEVLIVTSILVIILAFGSQLFLTSARSNKSTRDNDVAQGLADEELEAVKGVTSENWLLIFAPPDGAGTNKGSAYQYHAVQQATKWALATSTESVNVDGLIFTRYFTVDNVSRDGGGNILISGGSDDPSTQKITIYVSWPNATPITTSEYITRWRNKVCVQSDWSGGIVSGTSTCLTNVFGSLDLNLDVSTSGSLKLAYGGGGGVAVSSYKTFLIFPARSPHKVIIRQITRSTVLSIISPSTNGLIILAIWPHTLAGCNIISPATLSS